MLWSQRPARCRSDRRIAGFPFEICDLTDAFERTVLADFAAEHEAGRTPNPCARCNGEIKFGAFLRRADELGIDLVASGHYVRRRRDRARGGSCGARPGEGSVVHAPHAGPAGPRAVVLPGRSAPQGETRALAERFGLPVATKPDSQELCFAPSGDADAYAREHLPHLVREGEVVDAAGEVLGRHDGAFAFTIGQRRGTGVATGERRYVTDVDPSPTASSSARASSGTARAGGRPHVVGRRRAADRRAVRGRGSDPVPRGRRPACAEALGATGSAWSSGGPAGGGAGQSAVLYRGDEVLGGVGSSRRSGERCRWSSTRTPPCSGSRGVRPGDVAGEAAPSPTTSRGTRRDQPVQRHVRGQGRRDASPGRDAGGRIVSRFDVHDVVANDEHASRSSTSTSRSPTGADTTSSRSRSPTCATGASPSSGR